MKIKRFMYIETDIDCNNTVDFFLSLQEAQDYAKHQLTEAIKTLLGEDYQIPAEDVDEDGYIDHFPLGRKPEVSSMEWGWTVFDGISDTIRASIEEIEIVLTDEELEESHLVIDRENLLEDAKHVFYEFLKYEEDPAEGSYMDTRNAIVEKFFQKEYGISVQEAVTSCSKYYLLDKMVALFVKRQDSNLGDWFVWEQIVRDTLTEQKCAFQKEGPVEGTNWYAVSADEGKSWTRQLMTADEAMKDRKRGYTAVRINN